MESSWLYSMLKPRNKGSSRCNSLCINHKTSFKVLIADPSTLDRCVFVFFWPRVSFRAISTENKMAAKVLSTYHSVPHFVVQRIFSFIIAICQTTQHRIKIAENWFSRLGPLQGVVYIAIRKWIRSFWFRNNYTRASYMFQFSVYVCLDRFLKYRLSLDNLRFLGY